MHYERNQTSSQSLWSWQRCIWGDIWHSVLLQSSAVKSALNKEEEEEEEEEKEEDFPRILTAKEC